MEFLRDEDMTKVESVTDAKTDPEDETESRLGDPAVELETPEAWSDHQDKSRNRKEASGKRLIWLQVIGEFRAYFF